MIQRTGATVCTRRMGEVQVSLRTNCAPIAAEFAEIYAGYPDCDGQSPEMAMEVVAPKRRPWHRPHYRIFGDGVPIGPDRCRREAVPALEWAVNARVIATRDEFVLLHAASMVHPNGSGVILAGASGCGKSTLALGLMARGWGYLCDEFALIRPATGLLHAFPKAVCVKSGSFGLAREMNLPLAGRQHYVKGLKGRVGYVNPLAAGAVIGRPAPVRLIVFPRFAGQGEPRVSPLSAPKALFGLTGGLLNGGAVGPQAPDVLFRLSRQARCFSMRTGGLLAACDRIEQLMAEPLRAVGA